MNVFKRDLGLLGLQGSRLRGIRLPADPVEDLERGRDRAVLVVVPVDLLVDD